MRFGKLSIFFVFLLIIPLASAGVTRSIQDTWICPSEQFTVTLAQRGASNSYGVKETIGQNWNIISSDPMYNKLKDDYPNDGIKIIAWFGVSAARQIITYSLTISNPGDYQITGVYMLDSGNDIPIAPTPITVHPNSCITDNDHDGYPVTIPAGDLCGCAVEDCDDNPLDDSEQYTHDQINSIDADNDGNVAEHIHPGAQEIRDNNVDEDCSDGDAKTPLPPAQVVYSSVSRVLPASVQQNQQIDVVLTVNRQNNEEYLVIREGFNPTYFSCGATAPTVDGQCHNSGEVRWVITVASQVQELRYYLIPKSSSCSGFSGKYQFNGGSESTIQGDTCS